MLSRVLLGVRTALAVGGLLSFGVLGSLWAEPIRIPTEAPPAATVALELETARVIEHGQKLEAARRWAEALNHYEEALRTYPGNAQLEQRLALARAHFDLSRRYADTTFLQDVGRYGEREALDIYAEVLSKIQTNYVQPPQWGELVRRGAIAVEVAMRDPAFIEKHLAKTPPEKIESFLRDQVAQLDLANIRTPQQARDGVFRAGRLAWQYLGVAPSAVILEYTCGATSALDPYSTFLSRGQLDDVYSQIEGNFVGLGVELKSAEGSLLIVNAIEGSPAARGGIRAGDRIVEVDGVATTTVSTDKAADMLKGEEGTYVTLSLVSPNQAPRSLRIRRERVDVPSIEHVKMLDPAAGIGYFKITSFQKNTVRDLDAALWTLHRQGMKSLIVDLRGNPGGLLTASVEIADRFLEQGKIVSTRGRSPREDFDYQAHASGTWKVPLVVLVDRDSASASEIFAGAIRDQKRGPIVGERSYGKGSVQGIFPLNASKSGIRLTTAKFYSPSGQAISHQGVSPDVAVQFAAKPAADVPAEAFQASRDEAFLSAALQVARQQFAAR